MSQDSEITTSRATDLQSDATNPPTGASELARLMGLEGRMRGLRSSLWQQAANATNGVTASLIAREQVHICRAIDALLKESNTMPNILGEVIAERQRQDEQWGGSEHDDAHSPLEWRIFIREQLDRMTCPTPISSAVLSWEDYRERLVKIAALAVAAVESYDRRTAAMSAPPAETPPLTPNQRSMMLHAVGDNPPNHTRNYYCDAVGSSDEREWLDLVAKGYAEARGTINDGHDRYYRVTDMDPRDTAMAIWSVSRSITDREAAWQTEREQLQVELRNQRTIADGERQSGADMQTRLQSAEAERDALAAFKTYVHQRLDAAGIPTHPDGPHSREGCRVGDRLDVLIREWDAAKRHGYLAADLLSNAVTKGQSERDQADAAEKRVRELTATVREIEANTCEYCHSNSIKSYGPDGVCPGCGAPNCCERCCREDNFKRRAQASEKRADTAEKRVAEMEQSVASTMSDLKRVNSDIGKMRVQRTSRDSRAEMTRNAWKSTIIELILPRTERVEKALFALLHSTTTGDDGDAEPSDDDNERDRMIQESIDAAQDPEYLARMADYSDADRAVDEGGA